MKELCLGTALWGWGTSETQAFELLDLFYNSGFRYIDTAYNYPINNQHESFGASAEILSQWIIKNKINDLKIIYKVGSVSNNLTTDNNLDISYLIQQSKDAIEKFGNSNVKSIMIHWDNTKSPYDKNHFSELIDFLENKNITLGLSGVSPLIYKDCALGDKPIFVEGKFNIFHDNLSHYKILNPPGTLNFAYGISVSGLKFNENEYSKDSYVKIARDPGFHENLMTEENQEKLNKFREANPIVKNMYHAGILTCEKSVVVHGYIIGPRTTKQLTDILDFRSSIKLD